MIYARSHHTIVYFDLGFLHCLEDTETNFSTLPSDLKIRLIGNWVFRVALFGLWLGILFFVVFVGLGLLGSRKERKREVRCDFAQRLFLLLLLSVALYTIERVLLSDAPSPLPLSPCSLSDPTSTSIYYWKRFTTHTNKIRLEKGT